MKNITNKVCMILFVICLVLTMALSTAMSLSTGTMMTVFGLVTILFGSFSSGFATRLIGNLDSTKA